MNRKAKEIFVSKVFLLLLICILFVYVFIRAYILSFTHDECLTFNTVKGIAGYEFSANNHFLNTYLVTLFYAIFGAKEIFLRLPNVLAFLVYAYFIYKILVRFKRLIFILAGASLLLLNPYVLDFFSLARGYGISLAFGIGALYFLLLNNQIHSVKQFNINFAISMVMSLLSVYASLILINFNLTILLIFVAEFLVLLSNRSKQVTFRDKTLFFTIIIANMIFLISPISQLLLLKNMGGLYVGGSQSFIHNTLTSLIQRTVYLPNYSEWKWMKNLIVALFCISIIFQIMRFSYNQLAKITLVIMLMIGAFIFQHFLFGSLYPEGRMAIIFIPLFGVFFIETFHELDLYVSQQKYLRALLVLVLLLFISVPLVFHFCHKINFKYVFEWRYDGNTHAAVNEIKIQESKNLKHKQNITLSNEWFFEPSINYYRNIYSLEYLNPASREPLNRDADYIYCTFEEKERLKLYEGFIILKQFDDTNTILLKRKDSID